MDHAGFSTYESIYRAKEIFKADIQATLKGLPSYKHIHKVVIRDEEFPKTSSIRFRSWRSLRRARG